MGVGWWSQHRQEVAKVVELLEEKKLSDAIWHTKKTYTMRVADDITLDALPDFHFDQTVLPIQRLLATQHDLKTKPLRQLSPILEHLNHPLNEFLRRLVPFRLTIVFRYWASVGGIHRNRILAEHTENLGGCRLRFSNGDSLDHPTSTA